MYAKTLLFIAAAALAKAQTPAEIAEINAIINDVKANMAQYTSLATSGQISLSELPAGIIPLALAVQSATDDSYTTLYSNVDLAAVSTFLTKLPWYSSRLEGAIESATAAVAGNNNAAASSTAPVAASSSAAPVAGSSSAPVAASSNPATSLITSAVSSAATGAAATETAYTFRNTTVTVCEATSCHVAYVTETVCDHPEICQAKTTIPAATVTDTICTHPEICGYKNGTETAGSHNNGTNNGAGKTTAAIHQQTANGAVKAVAGLGAGALAAAALLL